LKNLLLKLFAFHLHIIILNLVFFLVHIFVQYKKQVQKPLLVKIYKVNLLDLCKNQHLEFFVYNNIFGKLDQWRNVVLGNDNIVVTPGTSIILDAVIGDTNRFENDINAQDFKIGNNVIWNGQLSTFGTQRNFELRDKSYPSKKCKDSVSAWKNPLCF